MIKYRRLNPDQRREQIAVLVEEAKQRGINIGLEMGVKTKVNFPTDLDGYFYKLDGTKYNPVSTQGDFIACDALFSLFVGPRGSGKTGAGIQKALRKIAKGESGAIMNPDFENFRISTWEEARRWIPWDSVVPAHRYRSDPSWSPTRPFTLNFLNGAMVICKGLKNPDSARGPNINWLWYDESGRDIDGSGWRIAVASVRVGVNIQAWCTGTPNGMRHWMYKFFVERKIPKEIELFLEEYGYEGELIRYYEGSLEANKENLNPMFYVSMNVAYEDGWEKQQEVEGKFVEHGNVLGDRSWFDGKVIPRTPDSVTVLKRVRYWDLAATERKIARGKKQNDPDRTVGTRLAYVRDGGELPGYRSGSVFVIEDQVGGYIEWKEIKDLIWRTALADGYFTEIYVEQEPGSGGKNQVAELELFFKENCQKKGIPQFRIQGHKPEGDKVQRANIWFAEAKEGKIYLVRGKWNGPFLEILDGFPVIAHDDEVDSMSGARITAAPIITWKDIPFRSLNDRNNAGETENNSSSSQSG